MRLILLFLLLLVSCGKKEPHGTLEEMQEKIADYPTYPYPYNHLAKELLSSGKKRFFLFAYGSLMSKESARRTLSEKTLATYQMAVGFGFRRVFDRNVPIYKESRYCIPYDKNARGMLNILISPSDVINGVLLDIEVKEDLQEVLKREEAYDLIPLIVEEWKDFQEKKEDRYMIAYTFHAKQNGPNTNPTILPRPGYYELVRDAAKGYGEPFEKMWFSTTYMADGKTPITVWEKAVEAGEQFTQAKCSK